MLSKIIGSKGRMGQTYVGGARVCVTKITVTPSIVTQIKNLEKDGYWAIQLGFGERKTKNMTKPEIGHLKGAVKENKAPKFLAEISFKEKPELNVGDVVKVSDVLTVGDVVSVQGVTKGKGFAGVVKRWHFAGGPKTHGQSDRERAPGSIGTTTTPGRVLKGHRMGGRMGQDLVTIKGFHIVSIDSEKNEIVVSGPVPGKFGDVVMINKISAGSLKDLEKGNIARVVEGGTAKIAGGGAAQGGTENA